MNLKLVGKSIGKLCIVAGVALLLAALVEMHYPPRGLPTWFFLPALIAFGLGALLLRIQPKVQLLYARDGIAVVALGWVVVTVLCALPYLLSGVTTSFVDALFESVSGYSTAGATIFRNLDTLSRGLLFWRSLTQWFGGLGFLAITTATSVSVKAQSLHILASESTGPTLDKIVPKLGDNVKIQLTIYTLLSALGVAALLLCRIPLFDSVIHTMGTVATGGFSSENASIAAYNNPGGEFVLSALMLASGVNFTLYYRFFHHDRRRVLRDEELRLYLGTFGVAAATIAVVLVAQGGDLGESLRAAIFQTSSIVSTTGYTSVNIHLWPLFTKVVLLLLMFVGGSAGSTAGGIKQLRFLMLIKLARREIARLIHPRETRVITINGKAIESRVLHSVGIYFFLQILLFCTAFLLLTLDTQDFTTAFTTAATMISNVGVGFGHAASVGHYADFSPLSKLVLTLCMFIGRLEIYPILVLFVPSFWRRSSN
ncbi:MAG: TrkH family potassium uptake protein [Oscillospiraceae bacterium]|jgi:trk system potassium uptake protein TrkH|nr:TrkH family potassium uptake protein [Oscillospiraceae bacterium]